jgi:hypothetical protein
VSRPSGCVSSVADVVTAVVAGAPPGPPGQEPGEVGQHHGPDESNTSGPWHPCLGLVSTTKPEGADDSPMRPVFDALRKDLLVLDPTVTEEFLKLYVAYQAETTFVEVRDSRGTSPASAGGQWKRRGSARLHRRLPCIMGLIRQAFEKQMGGDELASPLPAAGV